MERESPAPPQPFAVMAKSVGARCNMACTYCYYRQGGSCATQGPQAMTADVLERFIRQTIEASPGPTVDFVWHGGEPALAGLDFYRRAMELQAQYLPTGWTARNNLQTNGICFDEAWCAFLAESRFTVGLSIDGTQELHDLHRKDGDGNGTYRRAAEAVRRLQHYGVQPDLLCCVTAAAAKEPLAVYRTLRAFETGWIQFIPIVRRAEGRIDADTVRRENSRSNSQCLVGGAITDDSVCAEAYGAFLCAVFDEWVCHDLGRLHVQFFAEVMRVWAGGTADLCWMAPTCGRAPIVEQDGSVYACDHYATPPYRLGDIQSAHLGTLLDSPFQTRFGEDKRNALPAQCLACQWRPVCNGGCPKDRFALSKDGEPGLHYLCAGLRQFFSHSHPAAAFVTQLAQAGHSAAAIMARLQAHLQALWKDVGRNDACPCKSGRKAKNCCWSKRPAPSSDLTK